MIAAGLTGGTLDRGDALRHDPAALARVMDDRARLLALDGLHPVVNDDGTLGWTSLDALPTDALPILLGLDAAGVAHFAAWHSGVSAAEATPMRSPVMIHALTTLQPSEAAIYATARSVIDWHARHRFCANCGHETQPFRAGWARSCANCAAEHFPRVDPVVIMIAECDDRALLGRGAAWPEGRYSALAGFLEPGEAIEEAVAREVREETGVVVRDVRYVASQPWPFASSLMIACISVADDDTITLDRHELADAIWVSRDEVRQVLAGGEGRFIAPPRYAIARTLLETWAGDGL